MEKPIPKIATRALAMLESNFQRVQVERFIVLTQGGDNVGNTE